MTSAPHIILVHGLARSRHDMFLLAPRLRALLPQSRVHVFDYPTRAVTLDTAATMLCDFVHSISRDEPVSFVGHSLGGIVTRAMDLSGRCETPLHRLVTLGSPHGGAVIASWLSKHSIARSFFGPILNEIATLSLEHSSRQLEIGSLIGCTNTRFGFLPLFGEDNDGVVLAREAECPDPAVNKRVAILHAWFPFSSRTAKLSAHFLSTGSFDPTGS